MLWKKNSNKPLFLDGVLKIVLHTKGFVLTLDPFLDRGALISILTPEGLIFAFDARFFPHNERFLPKLKETFFEFSLTQGSDQGRYYIKKINPIATYFLSGESLVLWQLMQSFVSLTQNQTERSDLIFQSYAFLLQKLADSQNEEDRGRNYFYLTYTFFHSLDFLGQGPLIYHYQCAIEKFIPKEDHEIFHAAFASKSLLRKHFQCIFLYICQHWYTYFSSHMALEICYQCWIASIHTPLFESDAISSKSFV